MDHVRFKLKNSGEEVSEVPLKDEQGNVIGTAKVRMAETGLIVEEVNAPGYAIEADLNSLSIVHPKED